MSEKSIKITRSADIIVTCPQFLKTDEKGVSMILLDVEQHLNEIGSYEAEDINSGNRFRVAVRVHIK